MFVDFKDYDAVELVFIENNIDSIKNNDINIVASSSENIVINIKSDQVDKLFNYEWMSLNKIFLGAKYYILKTDRENILSANYNYNYEDGVLKDFMNFFLSCRASIDKVKLAEEKIAQSIIDDPKEYGLAKVEEYLLSLKKIDKSNNFNSKSIDEISNIMTTISFMARIALVSYAKSIDNNNPRYKEMHKFIAPLDVKNVSDSVIFNIFNLIGKLDKKNKLFDSNIHFLDTNVIAHTNRVFVMYSEFLYFYNNEFNFKGLAGRTRVDFKEKFAPYYSRIMQKFNPKRSHIRAMEVVSKNGMRSLRKEEMQLFALGAYWHDVVKVYNINYLVSGSSTEVKRSQAHVLNGYYLISHSRENAPEVSSTLAYHHEYFGHGYGLFTERYKAALESKKDIDIQYLITYDYKDMDNMEAIGYFPSKVLEIVDLYDFLRYDPIAGVNKYKNSSLALAYMREECLEKNVKLDPVLFNLFVKYIKEKNGEKIEYAEI